MVGRVMLSLACYSHDEEQEVYDPKPMTSQNAFGTWEGLQWLARTILLWKAAACCD